MHPTPVHHAPPSFRRRFLPVWAAAVAGALTLALVPPPAALLAAPEVASLPPAALRLLLLANPLLLVTALAALGAAAAHRVGLRSALAGTAAGARLDLKLAIACGLGVAVAMALVDLAWSRFLGAQWQAFLDAAHAGWGAAQLVLGIGYGGVAEEVMMRWGLMSGLAWLLSRGGQRSAGAPAPAWTLALATTLAAFAFALAHLPVLAQQVPLSPGVAARTLVLNTGAGLVFGWLYWRRTLETAMVAHASTHVGLAAIHAIG